MMPSHFLVLILRVCIAGGLSLVFSATYAAEQQTYPTPEAAVQALIDAAVSEDSEALVAVLGGDIDQLRSSDPVADKADREAFVNAAVEKAAIQQDSEDKATLLIGEDDWPFAIPMVRESGAWRFDLDAGLDEVYNRRIGRNELYTIAVLGELVQAQDEYWTLNPQGGENRFANKLRSSPGQRDGLYWPVKHGEPESPVGEHVAQAAAEGYAHGTAQSRPPFHGYYYRLLTAQGENAPGGAKDYVVNGLMSQGFGVVAWPADYGNSGIMSFITNQNGVIFETDLGENTAMEVEKITTYDPDSGWAVVTD
jgi:hypothetical protein